MLQKSPSGSLCPYHFKNAELHPLHYGSYFDDIERLQAVVAAEQAFVLASHGGRKVWVDLYETSLTPEVCGLLVAHFLSIGHKISKLALVGCPRPARHCLQRLFRQQGSRIATAYFIDPEIAKDWLVGIHH